MGSNAGYQLVKIFIGGGGDDNNKDKNKENKKDNYTYQDTNNKP